MIIIINRIIIFNKLHPSKISKTKEASKLNNLEIIKNNTVKIATIT